MFGKLQQPSHYHQTYLSQEELLHIVEQHLNPIECAKVVSAYEMSAAVHDNQIRRDGSPYFYHCTRVCKILLDELMLFDTDLLCAALLHDVLEDSDEITSEVLSYNFGAKVEYIVTTLTKDLERRKDFPEQVDREHVEKLKNAGAECLIIRLATRLDNFRCLDFDLKRNPIRYLNDTLDYVIPLALPFCDNKHLKYLVYQLRQESNKYIG